MWIILISILFCVAAQDLSPNKALNFVTFDCQLNIENTKWYMQCESRNFTTESFSKLFVTKLRGYFDPDSPAVYDELLLSTSYKNSELYLCESHWEHVLKIDPSILLLHCKDYKMFLTKLTKVLNETSLRGIKIYHTPKVEVILNILNESSHLSNIDLSENSLSNISSFPLYENNSITTIVLQRNEIENITEGLFSKCPRLQILDLSHNLLKFVDKNMFEGITTLLKLDLSFNSIEIICNNSFSDLVSLKILFLNNNNLKYISEDLFIFNNRLEDIDMSNNELENLPPTLFSNFRKLKHVSCSNCSLFALDEKLFENSPILLQLNFSRNNLKSLHEDIFKDMQFLRVLDLGNNKISHLTQNNFKNKHCLEILNLTHNEIHYIKSGLFFEAANIKHLDMSLNKITILSDDHLKIFTDLEYISLCHNRLMSINIGLTEKDLFIRRLDISDNVITEFNIGWKRLIHMEKFIADYNYLTSLDLPSCIPSIRRSLTFSFEYNNISKITLDSLILDDVMVKVDKRLAGCATSNRENYFIDLTHNPLFCDCNLYPFYEYLKEKSLRKHELFVEENTLTCAGPHYVNNQSLISLPDDILSCPFTEECPETCFCGIRGKDNLSFVNCSSRNFTEVPQIIPVQTSVLYFNGNKLESMVSLNSEVWRNLSELRLDYNFLDNLHDWSIPESLNYLSLRGNKLKTLPPSVMQFIANQSSFQLFLGDNDEICECDRKELKNFLMNNMEFVKDNDDIICLVTNNETSTFLPLTSVPDNDLCPLNSSVLNFYLKKLVISLCVLFSCIIVLLLVYYRQRHLILSFLYVSCEDLFNLCFSEDDYDENHIFDAFVAYSSNDREIVLKLVEGLETCPPYFQLCIHERNWLPGQFIADNIINSVHSSKRTIILLSSSFVESPWFNLELRAAVCKMSKDKMSRVIIVLAEKSVSLDNIDSELRHVISKRTYLVWGERWFWQKLRYAMPRKKHAKCVNRNNRVERSISEVPLVPANV